MQRVGSESLRPGSKRSKHRGGASGRSVAVGVPLGGALLFVALLGYSASTFWNFSSFDDGSLHTLGSAEGGSAGSRTAATSRERRQLGDSSAAVGAARGGSGDPLVPELMSDGNPDGDDSSSLHRSSWMSAALLWAEEHHQQRLRQQASQYQQPTGCGLLPCQQDQLRRPQTLVLYAYAAVDAEQQKNFEFFVKHGVEEHAWLTYRIIVASGGGVLAPTSLPELPPSASYIQTTACATSAWGILAAVAPQLAGVLQAAEHIVVVGSAARGPFMPPYTKQYMHWTDALTAKLTKRTKLVGSVLSCEGAPKGGDAADEWRMNPFVLPYAWATDKEGWGVMAGNSEVLHCYDNVWDARYYSDSGASLALLTAGFNIDTLLTKYQGLDWWNQRTWDCNARVRPDAEWTYDGVSISPFETVFVPFSQGPLQNEWSYVRQAAKYQQWMDAQASAAPAGNANAFVSEAWTLRAQKMIAINSRGPGCFDFDYYVKSNPDMASKSSMHQLLWEHFVLVGQFQGRPHRFTCPLQVGNSYKQAYVRARGRRCFDHNHYSKNNMDVRFAGITEAYELFNHYADFGQFEKRAARFVCTDSMYGLPSGFDTRPLQPLPLTSEQKRADKWQGLAEQVAAQAEAGMQHLQQQQQRKAGAGAGGTAAAHQQQAQAAAAGGDAQAQAAEQQQQQQQARLQAEAEAADAQLQAAAAAAAQQAAARQQQEAAQHGEGDAGDEAEADAGAAFDGEQASDAEAFLREQELQQAAGGEQR